MNTYEINKKLRHYYDCFVGTYPCDNIPNVIKRPASFIINTDPASEPGEHWIVIWLKDNYKGEYFDPFGFPPLNHYLISYLNKNCFNGWSYNPNILQNFYSDTCGKYCIIYIKFKCLGISTQQFFSVFTSITEINEEILDHFYNII